MGTKKDKPKKLKCKIGDVVLVAYLDALPSMILVTSIADAGTYGTGFDIHSAAEGRIDSAEQIAHNFGSLEERLAPTFMLNGGQDPSRPE